MKKSAYLRHAARISPIWWGVAPRVINAFIEQAEMEGKTVIPFATSGGSPVEPSVKALKESYPDIKWQEGILTTVE